MNYTEISNTYLLHTLADNSSRLTKPLKMIIPSLCNQQHRNGMEFIISRHIYQLKDKGYNNNNIKIKYLRVVIATSSTLGTDQKPVGYPMGKYNRQSSLP